MSIPGIGANVWIMGLALAFAIAFAFVGARPHGASTEPDGVREHALHTDSHAHDSHAHDSHAHDSHVHGRGAHGHVQAPLPPTPPAEGSLYHLDDTWHDQHEHAVELAAFRGRPVLVTMFYGNCQTACPLLLHRARRLQHELGGQVPVVAVTFDPVSDTPEAMRHYAAERGYEGDDWHFLMGSPASIRMLATLLGVQFHRRADGHYDHSNLIALLDAEGVVRLRTEGVSPDVTEVAAAMAAFLDTPEP